MKKAPTPPREGWGGQAAPPGRRIPRLWQSWSPPVPSSSLISLSGLPARGTKARHHPRLRSGERLRPSVLPQDGAKRGRAAPGAPGKVRGSSRSGPGSMSKAGREIQRLQKLSWVCRSAPGPLWTEGSALPGAPTGSCSGTGAPAPIYPFNCLVQEPSLSQTPRGRLSSARSGPELDLEVLRQKSCNHTMPTPDLAR